MEAVVFPNYVHNFIPFQILRSSGICTFDEGAVLAWLYFYRRLSCPNTPPSSVCGSLVVEHAQFNDNGSGGRSQSHLIW